MFFVLRTRKTGVRCRFVIIPFRSAYLLHPPAPHLKYFSCFSLGLIYKLLNPRFTLFSLHDPWIRVVIVFGPVVFIFHFYTNYYHSLKNFSCSVLLQILQCLRVLLFKPYFLYWMKCNVSIDVIKYLFRIQKAMHATLFLSICFSISPRSPNTAPLTAVPRGGV